MANLRNDHPHLYRQLVRKSLLHIGLGLGLILSPPIESNSLTTTLLTKYGLDLFGAIFVILGAAIFVSTFYNKQNYIWVRRTLWLNFYHDLMWLIVLVISAANDKGAGITIIALWIYLLSHIWATIHDPGWKAILFIKQNKFDNQQETTDRLRAM